MGVRKKVTNKELCMQDHTLSHLVVGWILRMQTATHADLQMHLLIYNSWFSILHTSKTENL
jgi:hypothetical protein